jgi:hypothetical protein
MDSVVIPPASASTNGFIASDNDHGRHHGGHGHHGYQDRDWPERTAERVRGEVFDSERTRNEETRDILAAVGREGAAGSLATEKNGAAGILATNVASGAIGVAIERTSAAGQLATNVAGQQVQNLALQQFNLLTVQAATNVAATNLAIQVASSAGLVQAVKDAAAAQLYAAQNHAAALAQAAACCCEIKERIREDGEKTRDLVNSFQATNLAVQLADAKQEVLVLRARLPLAA